MAGAFRTSVQAGNAATSTSSSLSITIPATAQPGDVAVLTVATTNTSTLTTPTGWTVRSADTGTGMSYILTKTLVAGDINTAITLSFSATTKPTATIVVYSGVTETGLTLAKTVVSTATVTWTVPSVAATASGVVHYASASRTAGTIQTTSTTPTTYTLASSSASSSTTAPNSSAFSFYKLTASSATVGGETHTLNQTNTGTAYAIAFAPSATAAAKISTLVETFDAATLNSSLWTPTGTAITTSGGRLNLLADSDFEGIESVSGYDLTASQVYFQWYVPSGSSQTFFTLRPIGTRTVNDNELTFLVFSGTLSIIGRDATVETKEDIGTYDPSVHGTWARIRHVSGGIIAFETSVDGLTWTQRGATKTVTWSLASVVVRMTAGGFSGAYAYYDNLNVPAVSKTKVGSATPSAVYVGTVSASKMYVGSTQIFP
jgi:hypothetical protein